MVAYVDSSVLVALGLREGDAVALRRRILSYDTLLSANLLEAEVGSAFRRERAPWDAALLRPLEWVVPDRPLTEELDRVFAAGYLKGSDAWHVACALYVAGSHRELPFITLDTRQRDVAAQLGFPTP